MATITLNYNAKDIHAQKTLEYILSMGFFTTEKKVKKSDFISVTKHDTLMSKKDFFAKIDRSLQEAKEGKTYHKLPAESLSEFLKRTQNVQN